eukprot:GFKZ01013314.1.p1 GENE.GFKZ01013314.1~~GFKZ01013314.1.p1  ORF type:complete len:589 (+),score=80.57 GFKZ01013314.1:166-1767(+)
MTPAARNMCTMPPAANPPPTLNIASPRPPFPLTDLESRIFALLLDVVHHEKIPDLTLRVAGGWVRDKILCPHKDLGTAVDIDIALDTMLGRDFAERINSYMVSKGLTTHTVGLIQKNPDQSKHLETATMRVMDVWLDLVNLRTETYSHDSRIPDVAIGTPFEDAMRRDLTINALFYNINTSAIEDYTNKGFDDIRARFIRTPLPPLTTLLDDPLRALRAVRFASRLNFKVHPDLFEACRDPGVHEALGAKVSRERVSAEFDRMISSQNPTHAIGLLVELGLFTVVFRMPPESDMVDELRPPSNLPAISLGALLNLRALEQPVDAAEARLVRYAALLSPMANCRCLFADGGRKRKANPLALHMLRSELRLAAKDAAEVVELHASALQLKRLVHKGDVALNRLETGKVLREAGKTWRSALQIALIMELTPGKKESTYRDGVDGEEVELPKEMAVVAQTYNSFQTRVEGMGFDGVWDLKPVVNGRTLMELLPGIRKGPIIGQIMREQVEWMIENPGKGVEDVTQWLLSKYSELATS